MFKDRLKELRKNNQWTMDTLVELYNKKFDGKLNKSTISRYESGLQKPILSTANNFAVLFNVPIGYFIEEWDSTLRADEAILIAEYNKLNDLNKRMAIERVRELTKECEQ